MCASRTLEWGVRGRGSRSMWSVSSRRPLSYRSFWCGRRSRCMPGSMTPEKSLGAFDARNTMAAAIFAAEAVRPGCRGNAEGSQPPVVHTRSPPPPSGARRMASTRIPRSPVPHHFRFRRTFGPPGIDETSSPTPLPRGPATCTIPGLKAPRRATGANPDAIAASRRVSIPEGPLIGDYATWTSTVVRRLNYRTGG